MTERANPSGDRAPDRDAMDRDARAPGTLETAVLGLSADRNAIDLIEEARRLRFSEREIRELRRIYGLCTAHPPDKG